jgi:hypothetical protein
MTTATSFRALLWVAAGLAVLTFLIWGMPAFFGDRENRRSEEYLSRVAAELNRGLPTMIDRETELTSATAAPGMLIYSYRLVNFSATNVSYDEFAAAAKQQVVQGGCGNPATRDGFLREGVTLRYSYYDKDKKHIATVNVSPADCGF